MKKVVMIILFLLIAQHLIALQMGSKTFYFEQKVRVDDSVGSSYQKHPDMEMDSNNYLYTVWEDKRDGGQSQMYFAKSTDKGRTFSQNISLTRNTGYASRENSYPDMFIDNNDNIYIVWQYHNGTSWLILFTMSSDRGANFTAVKELASISDFTYYNDNDTSITAGDVGPLPKCAAFYSSSDSKKYVYITWCNKETVTITNDKGKESAVNTRNIYCTRSEDGGTSFKGKVKVNDGAVDADQRHSNITIDNSGNLYLVWEDGRNIGDLGGGTSRADIYFSKSMDKGLSFNPNIKVNGADIAGRRYPSIVYDNTRKNVYVAWEDDFKIYKNKVAFAKLADNANAFSTTVDISGTTGVEIYRPSLSINNDGLLIIGWHDARDGNYRIYMSASSNGGANFSGNQPVGATFTGTNENDIYAPSLNIRTINGIDNFFLVWSDLTVDSEGNIHAILGIVDSYTRANLEEVILYPNPYKPNSGLGHMEITFRYLTADVEIKIYDLLGNLVYYSDSILNTFGFYRWIPPDEISSGIYFYYITNAAGQITKGKFAIIK